MQPKTNNQGPDTFATLSQRFTNFTTKKEKHSRGKYSSQTIIHELEALECLNLEDSLQDLPSIEDHIPEVERLTEQMEKKLEEYFND